MNSGRRQILFNNTSRCIGAATAHIQERQVGSCSKADPDHGAGVTAALQRLASA